MLTRSDAAFGGDTETTRALLNAGESSPFLVETLHGSRLVTQPSSSISSTSSPQSSAVDERRRQPALPLARPMIDLRVDEGSKQFVVLNERPRTPYTPSRCNVRVSSKPSSRLAAADWFRSSSSPVRGPPGLRCTPGAGTHAEAACATRLARLRQVAHHVLRLCHWHGPGLDYRMPA